ncbi:MAG: serine hydrolase [Pseudomonadota bacterium]
MSTETVSSLMDTAIAAVVNTASSTPSSTLAPQGIVGVYYGGQSYYQPGAFTGMTPPTETSAFGLGSVTKTFSTAVMGLLGNTKLTEEIGNHVPHQFALQSSARQWTLSQLAGFCSGLPNYPCPLSFAPKAPGDQPLPHFPEIDNADDARFLDFINSFIPPMQPGPYIYSDIAIGLAATIAMYHAGFDKFHAEHTLRWWSKNLFKPLGMVNTGAFDKSGGFNVKGDPLPNLISGYEYLSPQGQQAVYSAVPYQGWCPWGAAGRAYSTCADMLSFVQALVGETSVNNKPVASSLTEALTLSLTPVSPSVYPTNPGGSENPNVTQALAWVVNASNPNATFASKDGDLAGISSYVTVCPDLKLGTVILTNMKGVSVGPAADTLTQGLMALAT